VGKSGFDMKKKLKKVLDAHEKKLYSNPNRLAEKKSLTITLSPRFYFAKSEGGKLTVVIGVGVYQVKWGTLYGWII